MFLNTVGLGCTNGKYPRKAFNIFIHTSYWALLFRYLTTYLNDIKVTIESTSIIANSSLYSPKRIRIFLQGFPKTYETTYTVMNFSVALLFFTLKSYCSFSLQYFLQHLPFVFDAIKIQMQYYLRRCHQSIVILKHNLCWKNAMLIVYVGTCAQLRLLSKLVVLISYILVRTFSISYSDQNRFQCCSSPY